MAKKDYIIPICEATPVGVAATLLNGTAPGPESGGDDNGEGTGDVKRRETAENVMIQPDRESGEWNRGLW